MTKALSIISGMAPGPTGVGELLRNLLTEKKQAESEVSEACRIVWGTYGYPVRRHLKEGEIIPAMQNTAKWFISYLLFHTSYINRQIDRESTILVIHPQSLGFKWTLNLIRNAKHPVWLFLADSSFFCVRSYNFIPGEKTACTRCIGGDFKHSKLNNCKPYPIIDAYAFKFVEELMLLARSKRVRFIAQNSNQSALARQHFGHDITIKIAGLWASGWLPADHEKNKVITSPKYDIIFHGRSIAAKGADWALKLASHLPKYRFLFPFPEKSSTSDSPPNCYFEEMSWGSGLKNHVINSKMVLVPSFWSTPIEGALIKSISYAKKTAVVKNSTSFSEEIPDNVILKLSSNPEIAASQIHSELTDQKITSSAAKDRFLKIFEKKNKDLLSRLFFCINQ